VDTLAGSVQSVDEGEAAPPERRSVGRAAPRTSVNVGRLCAAVHAVTLVAAFVVVLVLNRNQWFFGDDFEFLVRRGLHHAQLGIWTPHNEHWTTVPILIYRALFSMFGLRYYLPYVVPVAAAHVLAGHLLWRIMGRAGVQPVLATALATVFLFLGAGSENLLWAFQVTFVGSLSLGLLFVVCVDHDGPIDWRDWAGWAVAIVALMFSGVTVTLVAVGGIVALLRRGWRRAALVVAPPAAVYLVWLALAGHNGVGSSGGSIYDVPAYVWSGLTAALEKPSGFTGAGPVLVLALLTWLVLHLTRVRARQVAAFALAAGAVVLFTVSALGRSGLGAEQASVSRYVYTGFALMLPAIGVALTELAASQSARIVALVAVLAFVFVHNVGLLRDDAASQATHEQELKHQILAGAALARSGATLAAQLPEPVFDPDVTAKALERFGADGKLPPIPQLSNLDRLRAASALQLTVSARPLFATDVPATVPFAVRASIAPAADGCVTVSPQETPPQVVVSLKGPASLRVRPSTDGAVELFLVGPDGPFHDGSTYQVSKGRDSWINLGQTDGSFVMTVPEGGPTLLCPATDTNPAP
jgi:hypothetical protein